jgi:hypothetical protein
MPFNIYGMALSLLYNPVDYSSAHGELIFTLLEDTKPFNSSLYPDYKYVCDIYVNSFGVTTLVARLKSFPRPGDKIGVFNIGNVVRNYLSTQFYPGPSTYMKLQDLHDGGFYVNVICRFGEEYGFTTYSNILIDSQRTYYNHYNDRLSGATTILPSYLDKALTSRPYATKLDRNANYNFVPFLISDDSQYNVVVKCYNSLGLIRQATFPITPETGAVNWIHQYNLTPKSINFNYGSQLIDDYIDYYTVTFDTTNIVDDSTLRFDLTCEKKYEVFALHFLNKYGGFDSKDFSKLSRRSIDVSKSDFGKLSYTIDSNGIAKWYNSPDSRVYNERTSVYASEWTEKLQLNTDILSNAEYVWLKELVKSPMVYIEQNEYLYPVKVVNTNYEDKKVINDELTNLTLNIEFSDRFNAQYR